MSSRLTPLSYAVLGLIGRGGASAHDLVDMVRRGGRIYWAAAPSKLYAEPKRLERLGLVRSEKRPGRTRERTFYTLTDDGLAALREWLDGPASMPRMYHDAVIRAMCGDLVGDEALLASLLPLREELLEWRGKLEEAARVAASLPHRERYLRLVHELGQALLQAQLDWLDRVEAELGGGSDPVTEAWTRQAPR
jgi:DNA-binding PadR family transcriptional regulator